MGRVEPRLRCVRRDGGTWKGFAIHHQQGTPPKTGEARLELVPTCPHPRNPPAHPHPRRPLAPAPYPVTLPACFACLPRYPRSARRLAKVELFNPQHHHPNPKRRSRLNPNPIAGSTGCRLHIHCTATCRQTVITWLVERQTFSTNPRFALRLCPNSARPMAS